LVEFFSNNISDVVKGLSCASGRFGKVHDRRIAVVKFRQLCNGRGGRIALQGGSASFSIVGLFTTSAISPAFGTAMIAPATLGPVSKSSAASATAALCLCRPIISTVARREHGRHGGRQHRYKIHRAGLFRQFQEAGKFVVAEEIIKACSSDSM
jgi:hypothetical protein